jgi:hypothetical protein
VALLLFFSVFGSTLTAYNTRNALFAQKIETLSVARELKGNSLVLNIAHFEENCKEAKIRPRPYSFMVAIFPANHPADQIVVYEDDKGDTRAFNYAAIMEGSAEKGDPDYDKDPSEGQYFCEYLRVGETEFSGKEGNYIARFYPVAVQTRDPWGNVIIVPAIMAMVVW